MNSLRLPEKDEREKMVEDASLALGYRIICFGLLLDVIYRSFRLGDSGWDLLALIIGSSLAATIYQTRQRTLTGAWAKWALLTAVAAAAVGMLLALLFSKS